MRPNEREVETESKRESEGTKKIKKMEKIGSHVDFDVRNVTEFMGSLEKEIAKVFVCVKRLYRW